MSRSMGYPTGTLSAALRCSFTGEPCLHAALRLEAALKRTTNEVLPHVLPLLCLSYITVCFRARRTEGMGLGYTDLLYKALSKACELTGLHLGAASRFCLLYGSKRQSFPQIECKCLHPSGSCRLSMLSTARTPDNLPPPSGRTTAPYLLQRCLCAVSSSRWRLKYASVCNHSNSLAKRQSKYRIQA